MMGKVAIFVGALIFAVGVSRASAQETRGAIEGTVKDSSGGVLPGVTVEAQIAAGAVQATTSNDKGIYRFPALQPGTYTVTANLSGFAPAGAGDVKVTL